MSDLYVVLWLIHVTDWTSDCDSSYSVLKHIYVRLVSHSHTIPWPTHVLTYVGFMFIYVSVMQLRHIFSTNIINHRYLIYIMSESHLQSFHHPSLYNKYMYYHHGKHLSMSDPLSCIINSIILCTSTLRHHHIH